MAGDCARRGGGAGAEARRRAPVGRPGSGAAGVAGEGADGLTQYARGARPGFRDVRLLACPSWERLISQSIAEGLGGLGGGGPRPSGRGPTAIGRPQNTRASTSYGSSGVSFADSSATRSAAVCGRRRRRQRRRREPTRWRTTWLAPRRSSRVLRPRWSAYARRSRHSDP